jgi:CreA protein
MAVSKQALFLIFGILIFSGTIYGDSAEVIGYVNYNARFPRADRIYVEAFDDPKVKNVTCYVSRALLGGVTGILGLVTEPSRVSVSCQKIGPVSITSPIDETENGESVFSAKESFFFKRIFITRFVDRKRRVLVYMAWTTGLIEGQPFNIINTINVD